MTGSFLAFTLSLALFYRFWPSPPSSQKFAVLLEIYFLSWVFLIIGTVGVNNLGLGGAYLFTTWNLFAWLAAAITLVEAILRARWTGINGGKPSLGIVEEPEPEPEDPPTGHRFVRGIRYDAPNREEDGENAEGALVETEPTEITPLMQQQRRHSAGGREYIIGIDNRPIRVDDIQKKEIIYEEYFWWIAQMLTLLAVPTILLFQVTLILVHALRNTLADGSPPFVGEPAILVFYCTYVDLLVSVCWLGIPLYPYIRQCRTLRPSTSQRSLHLDLRPLRNHADNFLDHFPFRAGCSSKGLLSAKRAARPKQQHNAPHSQSRHGCTSFERDTCAAHSRGEDLAHRSTWLRRQPNIA